MKNSFWIAVAILVVILGLGIFYFSSCSGLSCSADSQKISQAVSFEKCVELGFPIMETSPRQCVAGEKVFIEQIAVIPTTTTTTTTTTSTTTSNTSNSNIRVTTPTSSSTVKSPLVVKGEARGTWYFEASFPVKLLDANGKVLAQAPAQAKSDWMTNDFVPFEATLTFTAPTTGIGTLVLSKDNPSGLPQNAGEIRIPVKFTGATTTAIACIRSGCSGEICSDQNQVSNCIYKPEFACYAKAKCERQMSGQCGWTQTSALSMCLSGK
ncbi:hypothetical protein H0W91_01315 [Patescibacteria group bacterium]|nr:hypothetical protein [Patescibacteria group bacterium]